MSRIALTASAAALVSIVVVSGAQLPATSVAPVTRPNVAGAHAMLRGDPVSVAPLPTSGPPPIIGQGPDPDRPYPASLGAVPGGVTNGDRASNNWSGEVDTGTTFTAVSGNWTVPAVVASQRPEYTADWVGIGGVGNNRLIQTGTVASTSSGATQYNAWYELLPSPAITINKPVSAGDEMAASVRETSSNRWLFTIEDTTKGWLVTGTVSYTAGPATTAEWIVERPYVNTVLSTLAEFGSSRFFGMASAGADLTVTRSTTFDMVKTTGTIIAYPGHLLTSGTPTANFTDYYGTPLPTVGSISPQQGATTGGNAVTISGTFLVPGLVKSVHFGTVAASNTVRSNGTITAIAPAEPAGTVNVTGTTTDGTSALSSADHYTYLEPAPTMTSFSPISGPTTGGTTVTITGTGFSGTGFSTSAVKFGTTTAKSYTVTSSTTIEAVTKPHVAGAVKVKVTTAGGTATSAGNFNFIAPATVTSFAPTTGPSSGGSTVTISGAAFTGASAVKFGTTTAASFRVTGPTMITAVTKAHPAGTVRISVTTLGGTGTSAAAFDFVPPMSVGEVSTIGSATTYKMMHNLFPASLNDLLPGGTTPKQQIAVTPMVCATGVAYGSTNKAPASSTAGKAALAAEESAPATKRGCIDFVRSSSPPRPSTTSTHFDSYAYALEGVGIVVGAGGGGNKATPVTLTLTQIREVYSCWNGSSVVTTWAQIGISTSTTTINRFWPETGADIGPFYADLLGFTPTKHTTPKDHCPTLALTHFANGAPDEGNSEEGMLYANSLPDTNPTYRKLTGDFSIYSANRYASQWDTYANDDPSHTNAVERHGGATANAIGNFVRTGETGRRLIMAQIQNRSAHHGSKFILYSPTTAPPHPTGVFAVNPAVVSEANEWYHLIPHNATPATASTSPVPGVRYLYNVADAALPSYGEAKMMIGFDNQATGTESTLCHGDDSSAITASGFLPLNSNPAKAPTTSDKARGSTCREFPGQSYPGLGGSESWIANTWVSST